LRIPNIRCFVLMMIIAIVLTGCSGGTPTGPAMNFTGNWTMKNTATISSIEGIGVGETITAICSINDNNGSLSIYKVYIIGQESINWEMGYGTRSGNKLTANINGSYLKINGDRVSVSLSFEGEINTDGISGTGYWSQSFNINNSIDSAAGTTVFVKG